MLPHKNEFCKWLSMWNWSARIPLRKYWTKIAAEKSRNSHLRNPQIGLFRCLCGIMSFNSTRAFRRRKNCERRQGRWSNGRRCRLGCRQKPSWPFFSTAAMTINEQPIMYQHTVVDLKINTTRTTWFFNLVTAPFTSLRLARKKYFFFSFSFTLSGDGRAVCLITCGVETVCWTMSFEPMFCYRRLPRALTFRRLEAKRAPTKKLSARRVSTIYVSCINRCHFFLLISMPFFCSTA